MAYTFERKGNIERYSITPNLLKKDVSLSMEIKAIRNKIKSIKVNGKDTPYTLLTTTILSPEIKFEAGIADKYDITIEWDGEKNKQRHDICQCSQWQPVQTKYSL